MPRTTIASYGPKFKKLQSKMGILFEEARGEASKKDMAAALGVSLMTVLHWERGENVNLHTVFLYAKMAKLTVPEWFTANSAKLKV